MLIDAARPGTYASEKSSRLLLDVDVPDYRMSYYMIPHENTGEEAGNEPLECFNLQCYRSSVRLYSVRRSMFVDMYGSEVLLKKRRESYVDNKYVY